MWLQTASEFSTRVRIFGEHSMISRDVHYETPERPAAAFLRTKQLPRPGGTAAQ
jgi:hypothetical protein